MLNLEQNFNFKSQSWYENEKIIIIIIICKLICKKKEI